MNSDRRIFSPKKQIQALRHNGHRAKKERRKLRTSTETFSSPASSGLDLRIQSQTSWRNSALSDVTWHPIKKNHFLVCTEGIFKSLFPSSSLSIAPYRSFDTCLLHGEDSWISRFFYEKAEYLEKDYWLNQVAIDWKSVYVPSGEEAVSMWAWLPKV